MIVSVIGRMRDRVRGQDGLISAGALIGIALLLVFLYLLLAAFQGDSAEFGQVGVPGSGRVELPEGDIDVYYAEGADPDAGVTLITPADLEVVVTGPDGRNVPVTSRGADAKATDDGVTRLIGSLQAPVDGFYTVKAESTDAAQRITPAVTFGQGPFASVRTRFEDVVDVLRGPVGIVVLAILLILFLLPRFKTARRRASYLDK